MGPDKCYLSNGTASRKKVKACRKLFPTEKTEIVRIVRLDISETERENKIHTLLSHNLLKRNNLFTNLISSEYSLKRQQLTNESDKTFSELVELAVQCTETVFTRELKLTIQPLMQQYFEDLRRSSEEFLRSLHSSNNVNCVLEEDVLNIADDKIISTHVGDLLPKYTTSEDDNPQELNKISGKSNKREELISKITIPKQSDNKVRGKANLEDKLQSNISMFKQDGHQLVTKVSDEANIEKKLPTNFTSQQNYLQLSKVVSRKANLEESQLSKKLSKTFLDVPLPKVVRAKLNPEEELQSDVTLLKGDDVPKANKACKKQNNSQLCKVVEEINLEKGLQSDISTLKKDSSIHSVNKLSKEENMLPLSLNVMVTMSQRIEHNTEYKLRYMEYGTLNLQEINISNMQGVSVALAMVLKSLDNFIEKNEDNKFIKRAKILKMAIISLLQ